MNQAQSAAVMSNTTPPPASTEYQALGHLTVRPEGSGPREIRFDFEFQQQRVGGAIGASVLTHVAFVFLIVLLGYLAPEAVPQSVLPDRLPNEIVWLAEEGPGGGGGGGGNNTPEPPKKAELPGKEKLTVPALKTPAPEIKPKPEEPKPDQTLNIPAKTMAAETETAPGVIESTQASNDLSQGPGSGGGAGTGTGTGIGPGQGSGLGPGYGGGTGGGAYRPGNGVQLPRVLYEQKPAYTAEAMRAKVQGTVLLECIVLTDGTVGNVEIVRSLDQTFGLDQEAVKAAKKWRFAPGTRFGEPVPVIVTIELTFTLR
jgi:protein TonB